MKRFLSGLLLGLLTGGGSVFYYQSKEIHISDVKVTQVSGERIEHYGFKYKQGSIKFTTASEGRGEIFTEIPTDSIPEVQSWNYNNHGLMFEVLYTDSRIYGVSYMRRWNNFSIGGGVLLSEQKFEGLKVQAQYWFRL